MAFLESLIINEYLRFFSIFVGSIFLANVIHLILNTYFKNKTRKTHKILYKKLQKNIIKPLYILIIFIGLYSALKSLTFFGETSQKWINNIFYIALILASAALATKIFAVIINSWLKTQKHIEKPPQIISKILTIIIYIIALLIILDHFEVETTPFLATLGVGGLALGLALQNTLTNFFAGLHLVSDKPIQLEDFIELNSEVSGHVLDIGWRSTRLRTLQNTIIIVPNALLADSIITNNSSNTEKEIKGIVIIVECGVSYNTNLEFVEKITKEVATMVQKTGEGTVENFDPEIRYFQFADSNINFKVYLRGKEYQYKNIIMHEFIKALKKRFDKEGIEISFPARKLYYDKDLNQKVKKV